jgi:hypothetical protein
MISSSSTEKLLSLGTTATGPRGIASEFGVTGRTALVLHCALRASTRLVGCEQSRITGPVSRVHAEVWADLAERGEVIGAHDLWIAATSAHVLGVTTRNVSEFGPVPGPRVVVTAA